jgi:hypothetical protein
MTERTSGRAICSRYRLTAAGTSVALLMSCGGGEESGTTVVEPPPLFVTATALGGADQSAIAGAVSGVMTARFVRAGAPLANTAVAWTATAGTLQEPSTTTNAAGEATNRLSLVGADPGSVTVTARAAGASASFSIAVVTPVAGPPIAVQYARQFAVVDSQNPISLPASARDAAGRVVPGAAVSYVSRDPSVAVVASDGTVTGLRPGVTRIIAALPGGSSDSLVAIVAGADAPVVFVELPATTLQADSTITAVMIADMRSVATRLGAGRVVITWDPALLEFVSSAAGTSGVSATVNAANARTGAFVLAFASPTGYSGRTELQRLVFKVTAGGRRNGTVLANVTEAFASQSFADLKSRAVSVSMPFVIR